MPPSVQPQAEMADAPPPLDATRCKWFGARGVLRSHAYCASSSLPPQAGSSYTPDGLSREGPGDAWCEGRAGDGLGETIVFRMDPPQEVSRLTVENGYTKTPRIFERNGRVRSVEITAGDGTSASIDLADTAAPQTIELPQPVRTGWIALTVRAVYPGTRYSDTCISALRPDVFD